MKINPNIMKLSSLAVSNKEIEFVYKLRNDVEFELRFKEKLSLQFIGQFTRLEDLGKLKMNVEQDKVTIIFSEELANALYRLKEDIDNSNNKGE